MNSALRKNIYLFDIYSYFTIFEDLPSGCFSSIPVNISREQDGRLRVDEMAE